MSIALASLIPSIGTSAFDSTGERRLAERLEQKLDADHLIWHNVPMGPKQTYPDFVVLHPRRGLLILETKDWHVDTIQGASKQTWEILSNGVPKSVANPLAQARHCAIQVVNALERDAQLVQADGPHKGKLAFPWGHGVVFTRVTRKQFQDAGLGDAIPDHYVICKDEIPTLREEAFALHQRRLPLNVRKYTGDYNPNADAIQVLTMKVSKGLEFPVVALPGVGNMPAPGKDEKEAARVFYVAATRATQKLIITVARDSELVKKLTQ